MILILKFIIILQIGISGVSTYEYYDQSCFLKKENCLCKVSSSDSANDKYNKIELSCYEFDSSSSTFPKLDLILLLNKFASFEKIIRINNKKYEKMES